MPRLLMKEGTDTATPPSEYVSQYAKADGIMYWKDDAGNEYSMNATGAVSDTAYAGSWNAVTTIAPSKNAVYDKIETMTGGETAALVSDTAYDATSWNAVTTIAPSKNAVRDEIELIKADYVPDTGDSTIAGVKTFSSDPLIPDEAYGSGWNGSLEPATKNAIYDRLEVMKAQAIIIACSDETTALTTGTAKATFRMPFAFTLTSVRASVTTAPTGSTIIVDINETGTGTILSTRITIDASEKTSTTAAAPPVISDTALADDAEITIDIDQVGSTIAGAGLKVTLIGYGP